MTARDIVNAIHSDYYSRPIDVWAVRDGPGEFAAIMERHIAAALAAVEKKSLDNADRTEDTDPS